MANKLQLVLTNVLFESIFLQGTVSTRLRCDVIFNSLRIHCWVWGWKIM